MIQENEIIQAIKTLLQQYASNEKGLSEVSLIFKQDILAKLSQRNFALMSDNINSLFNDYQSAAYLEVISSFRGLCKEFKNPEQTIVSNSSSALNDAPSHSVMDVSFYDIDGHKIDQLDLESLEAGKLIDGRYQLIEKIGAGGMAVVWKALDKIQEEALTSDDQRYVAIKFIDSGLDKDMFANTVREANRTRSLRHDNIIDILTVGKTGGLLFIVMELLQGKTLKQFIKDYVIQSRTDANQDGFILPYELGMNLTQQIIEAIAYAHLSNEHKKGILHLDLKPENIFYNPNNGLIKVLDFGLARYATKEDDEKTVFKGVEGLTKSYASPEALRRYQDDDEFEENKPRLEPSIEDDVYSLACIIYELFSGKRPFGTLLATQAEEENKHLLPLKLKKNQWQALEKALAFDRKKRTQNVETFLHEFVEDVPVKEPSSIFIKVVGGGLCLIVLMTAVWFFTAENLPEPPIKEIKQAKLPVEDIKPPKQPVEEIEPPVEEIKQPELPPSEEIKKPEQPVETIKPPEPPVEEVKLIPLAELKLWALNNKTQFKIGDKLRFSFKVDKSMYVSIVSFNTSGKIETLFPLGKQKAYVTADKVYSIPEKPLTITVQGPAGVDKVRAFASLEKIPLKWLKLSASGDIDTEYLDFKFQKKHPNTSEPHFVYTKIDITTTN